MKERRRRGVYHSSATKFSRYWKCSALQTVSTRLFFFFCVLISLARKRLAKPHVHVRIPKHEAPRPVRNLFSLLLINSMPTAIRTVYTNGVNLDYETHSHTTSCGVSLSTTPTTASPQEKPFGTGGSRKTQSPPKSKYLPPPPSAVTRPSLTFAPQRLFWTAPLAAASSEANHAR